MSTVSVPMASEAVVTTDCAPRTNATRSVKMLARPTCPERTQIENRAASSTHTIAGSTFLFLSNGAIMRTTAPTLMMNT